jgi:hypothetical protein
MVTRAVLAAQIANRPPAVNLALSDPGLGRGTVPECESFSGIVAKQGRTPIRLFANSRLSGFLRLGRVMLKGNGNRMARAGRSPKRLVVDNKTGRYLKQDGTWTLDEAEAIDFEDVSTLIRICAQHHIKDAQVLLRFNPEHKFDVRIPLQN